MNRLSSRVVRLEAERERRVADEGVDPAMAAQAWAELDRLIRDYAHRKATGAEIPPELQAEVDAVAAAARARARPGNREDGAEAKP